jgi:hypothetical protein
MVSAHEGVAPRKPVEISIQRAEIYQGVPNFQAVILGKKEGQGIIMVDLDMLFVLFCG